MTEKFIEKFVEKNECYLRTAIDVLTSYRPDGDYRCVDFKDAKKLAKLIKKISRKYEKEAERIAKELEDK